MDIVDSIDVDIKVELGSTTMPVHLLLRMGRGAVIELDSTENDPLLIYANNALIAKGEVRIEESSLSVEVTERVVNQT